MLYVRRGRRLPLPRSRMSCPHFPALLVALLLLIPVGAGPGYARGDAPSADSGDFVILSGQRRIGTEKFKITPTASGLELSGEIQVNMPGSPRVSETALLKLDRNLRPLSYERQQKAPKKGSIAVQFGSPETRLVTKTDAGTGKRVFYLPRSRLVVLDTNFFHQYTVLLREYDVSRGGTQQFNVFVPQEATPGTISLALEGRESLQIGKSSREMNHYRAVTDAIRMDIWATPQGQIYRISAPDAKLEVVRQ